MMLMFFMGMCVGSLLGFSAFAMMAAARREDDRVEEYLRQREDI